MATPATEPAVTMAARRHKSRGWVTPSHTWLISAITGKDTASAAPQANMMASPRHPLIAWATTSCTSETGAGRRGRSSIATICARAASLTAATSSEGAIGSPTRTSTGE